MSIYDDAVAHSQQPQADPATQARAGMAVAVGTNPDAYAAAVRLSKIPAFQSKRRQNLPKDIEQKAAIGSVNFDDLAKTSPSTAALIADIEKAKVSHDDIENLSGVETTLRTAERGLRDSQREPPTILPWRTRRGGNDKQTI